MGTFFPEKNVKISVFDKKWFNPQLRKLHRQKQREYFKNRKSEKWTLLSQKFKKLKRKTIRNLHINVTSELKKCNPRKFFSIVKKITSTKKDQIQIQELEGSTSGEAAEKIANHFAKISNLYKPVDISCLPCYLPAPPPPEVSEEEIFKRLQKLKNTK